MIQGIEQLQQTGKENLDASMRSLNSVNRGWQALNNEVARYSKESFAEGTLVWEKLVGVRSLDRAFEVQSELFKSAYDSFLGYSTRLGEIVMETTRDACKPIESNFTAPAKKAGAK